MDEYPAKYAAFLDEVANETSSKEAIKLVFEKEIDELEKERIRWLRKRRG